MSRFAASLSFRQFQLFPQLSSCNWICNASGTLTWSLFPNGASIFTAETLFEYFVNARSRIDGLSPTLNVMVLNQNASLAVSKALIEKSQDTEVETDETNAQLICDKAEGSDDLLTADFQRGWNSVYFKPNTQLGWVVHLAGHTFDKCGIGIEVNVKTVWKKIGINIESDATSRRPLCLSPRKWGIFLRKP